MKTIDELRKFYDTALLGDLKVLEGRRKKVLANIGIAGAVIGVIAVVVIIALASAMGGAPPAFIAPIIIGGIVWGGISYLLSWDYVRQFKGQIIQQLVHFIDSNLTYSRAGYISRSSFVASKIFSTKPNVYKGDDLVRGKVGATAIEFSELNTAHESGSGKNRNRHTIFKGLFFIGDFNKHFSGRTVVLPDTAEKLFGKFGQKLQAMNFFRGKLIKLEDPEFEQLFAVYGDNQIEARYILSTSLMERIMDFKKKTGQKIYLSFVWSKVYVAISFTKSLFEPRIFNTLLDFKPVREYFEDLQLAIGIVEDLNLNTRIWSKQ